MEIRDNVDQNKGLTSNLSALGKIYVGVDSSVKQAVKEKQANVKSLKSYLENLLMGLERDVERRQREEEEDEASAAAAAEERDSVVQVDTLSGEHDAAIQVETLHLSQTKELLSSSSSSSPTGPQILVTSAAAAPPEDQDEEDELNSESMSSVTLTRQDIYLEVLHFPYIHNI